MNKNNANLYILRSLHETVRSSTAPALGLIGPTQASSKISAAEDIVVENCPMEVLISGAVVAE